VLRVLAGAPAWSSTAGDEQQQAGKQLEAVAY
jgi:hypothetical protein